MNKKEIALSYFKHYTDTSVKFKGMTVEEAREVICNVNGSIFNDGCDSNCFRQPFFNTEGDDEIIYPIACEIANIAVAVSEVVMLSDSDLKKWFKVTDKTVKNVRKEVLNPILATISIDDWSLTRTGYLKLNANKRAWHKLLGKNWN